MFTQVILNFMRLVYLQNTFVKLCIGAFCIVNVYITHVIMFVYQLTALFGELPVLTETFIYIHNSSSECLAVIQYIPC